MKWMPCTLGPMDDKSCSLYEALLWERKKQAHMLQQKGDLRYHRTWSQKQIEWVQTQPGKASEECMSKNQQQMQFKARMALLILYLHIHILQECQYAPLAITSNPQHYLCNTNRPTFIFEQKVARPTTFDQQRAEGERQHTKTTQATRGRRSLTRSGRKEGQCYNPKISCNYTHPTTLQ